LIYPHIGRKEGKKVVDRLGDVCYTGIRGKERRKKGGQGCRKGEKGESIA